MDTPEEIQMKIDLIKRLQQEHFDRMSGEINWLEKEKEFAEKQRDSYWDNYEHRKPINEAEQEMEDHLSMKGAV